ncbi:MAG: hypothetical protein RLZZ568_1298 [Cyanobacteriota bacterium]
MADSSSRLPLQTLNIGDVVTAGLRIYRDHFKPYYGQAFQFYLWITLAIIISLVVVLAVRAIEAALTPPVSTGIWIFVVLALFVPWGYCLAKAIAVQGVLARVAFFEVGEAPESLEAARIQLMPRFWRFLRTSLLVALLMTLCSLVVGGILALLLLLGSVIGEANPGGGIAVGILAFVWFWVGLFIYIWVFARLALTDVCLAVEPTLSPVNAVSRSWHLTHGDGVNLQKLFIIVFLLTLPLVVVGNLGSIGATLAGLDKNMATLINFPFSILVGALFIPFWQTIKAVVYCDLRTRKEGLRLSMDLPPLEDFSG